MKKISEMNLYYVYQPSQNAKYIAIEVTADDSREDIENRLQGKSWFCTYAENPEQAVLNQESMLNHFLSLAKTKRLNPESY